MIEDLLGLGRDKYFANFGDENVNNIVLAKTLSTRHTVVLLPVWFSS